MATNPALRQPTQSRSRESTEALLEIFARFDEFLLRETAIE